MQRIFAHRGASGYAPENTMEAFSLASVQGAHGVELDVHLSKDGEIVVAHDETIDRVSNGSGAIRNMTLAELKRFTFNKTQPAYKSAAIPTLEEVFAFLRPTGLDVNVELKTNAYDYPGLAQKCVDLADKMDLTRRVLYSSFNHESLLQIKQIDPALPCGLLYDSILVRPWAYAVALGMDALHPKFRQLRNPRLCEMAHKAGICVNTWTVDEPDDLSMVLKAGADIIITNYPDRALKALAQSGNR